MNCSIHTTTLAGGLLFLQTVHVFLLLPPTFLGRNLQWKGRKKDHVPAISVNQYWQEAMSKEITKALLTFVAASHLFNLLAHVLITSSVLPGFNQLMFSSTFNTLGPQWEGQSSRSQSGTCGSRTICMVLDKWFQFCGPSWLNYNT